MKNTFKIAGIQYSPSTDVERNLSKAASLVKLAASEGAKIICLPQLFNTHWFPAEIDNANFSLAETKDGRSVGFLREEAKKHGSVVIGSIFEEDNGSYYNTAFVAGPEGDIIGKYRKVHVPQIPLWEEKAYFKPGDLGFPVIKTPFGNIGVLLCWDIFFPEAFRILVLKGAQMIFAPTASAFIHSHRKWERAICAAAHANGCFIFRVNRVGRELRQEFYGKSFCAGPDGDLIGDPSGSCDGIIVAEIDLAELNSVRNDWVFLKDRRPGEYKEILESGS